MMHLICMNRLLGVGFIINEFGMLYVVDAPHQPRPSKSEDMERCIKYLGYAYMNQSFPDVASVTNYIRFEYEQAVLPKTT